MKTLHFLFLPLFFIPQLLSAQKVIYLNDNWLSVEKENATYYCNIHALADGKFQVKDYKIDGSILAQTEYSAKTEDIDWKRLYEIGFEEFAIENGKCIEYYPSGKKKKEFVYVYGTQKGKVTVWDESGYVLREFTAENHIANGEYLEFFEDGTTSFSVSFKNDSLNGPAVYYHENGKIAQEGAFSKSLKVGKWTYYNNIGEKLGTETYRNSFFIAGPDIRLTFPKGFWSLTDQFKEEDHMNFNFLRSGTDKGITTDFTPSVLLSLEYIGTEGSLLDYSSFRRRRLSIDVQKVLNKELELFSLPNSMGYLGTYQDKQENKHTVIVLHSIQKGIGMEYIFDCRESDYTDLKKEVVYLLRSMSN